MNTNILFVDDEASIRDAYRSILEPSQRRSSRRVTGSKAEYKLFFADCGERAVEIYKEQSEKNDPIAMGFFDMIMPGGIDGGETIRRIREIDPSILCVIVTAYTDRDTKEIRGYFDDQSMWLYLNKPFNDGEIRQLAASMIHGWNLRKENKALVENLEQKVRERTEELNAELEKVAIVQRDLLPHRLPQYPNLEIGTYYETCVALGGGGDYYDLVELPGKKLGVVIADASGHGPSAACIMAITRAMFRDLAFKITSPGELLEALNSRVDGNYPKGNFVTMFYGILDLNTGEMVSANAAHPYPLYGTRKGFKMLEGSTGMILGMFPGKYPETTVQLEQGDHLLLFTDGIEEHKSLEREEFGYARMIDTLIKYAELHPEQLIRELVQTADQFRPNLPREDDFTFVGVRWFGPL